MKLANESKNDNYKYEHHKIPNVTLYQKYFIPFMKQTQIRNEPANKYISIMKQNQYTYIAKSFIELYPKETFPLKISKQALYGLRNERFKNIILKKESPLVETFSLTLLRIFQTGICDHFGLTQTSIDFTRNPNIRTAEQDWNQIITLDIAKVFFIILLISGFLLPSIVLLPLEVFSATKYATILIISLKQLSISCNFNIEEKGRRIPIISIVQCVILAGFCFLFLTYHYKGISGGLAYCEYTVICLVTFSNVKSRFKVQNFMKTVTTFKADIF